MLRFWLRYIEIHIWIGVKDDLYSALFERLAGDSQIAIGIENEREQGVLHLSSTQSMPCGIAYHLTIGEDIISPQGCISSRFSVYIISPQVRISSAHRAVSHHALACTSSTLWVVYHRALGAHPAHPRVFLIIFNYLRKRYCKIRKSVIKLVCININIILCNTF